jgi:hypothetical protein
VTSCAGVAYKLAEFASKTNITEAFTVNTATNATTSIWTWNIRCTEAIIVWAVDNAIMIVHRHIAFHISESISFAIEK